ncbi:MAG TPA: SDR family oxidoreductase [Candidatus Thermoplasmatota archaeon]|nr:SDR family oxidoreductase [Candidatus Thermoplasmatota archaeon]
METVLVTGANGHLGRWIAEDLARDSDVLALVRRPEPAPGRVVLHDLASDAPVEGSFHAVVHVGGETDVRRCQEQPLLATRANVGGTVKLLEAARAAGARKFVYVSTGTVYAPTDGPVSEDFPVRPRDVYSLTKLQAEEACRYYSQFFPVVVLRYFFPYGPRTHPGRLVNAVLSRVREGREVLLHQEGRPRVNPIFVEDLVAATRFALESDLPGFTLLNVAGEERVDIPTIARTIGDLLGVAPRFRETGERPTDVLADVARLRKLGFSPKFDLRRGLARTLALDAAGAPPR